MNVSLTGLSLLFHDLLHHPCCNLPFKYLGRKVPIINLFFPICYCYSHPFILLHKLYQFIMFLPKIQIIEILFQLYINLRITNIYKILSFSITITLSLDFIFLKNRWYTWNGYPFLFPPISTPSKILNPSLCTQKTFSSIVERFQVGVESWLHASYVGWRN